MVKLPCYVCEKFGSHSYTVKDYWRSPQTPEGMTRDDFVCYDCYQKVKKEVIKYKKEHKEEIDRLNKEENLELKTFKEKQQKENKQRFDQIEKRFDKYGTIRYKDEYCAIVKKIDDLSFIMAFSDLTREGYRLMAQDEGGQFHLGIASVGAGSYYFFQKIEYVTLSDNTKNNEEMKKGLENS